MSRVEVYGGVTPHPEVVSLHSPRRKTGIVVTIQGSSVRPLCLLVNMSP